MTPKIAEFLRRHQDETPFLVVDLDKVRENFLELRRALPLAEIYYAVKANPAAPVLDQLVGLDSRFDAASAEEVELCLAAGADPARISYGNTVKKARDIRRAHEAGVRLFAFDSAAELDKLADEAQGARVFCRILTDNAGADWPLSRKFGCELEMARDLMLAAAAKGLEPHGISFHVGSQQTDPAQWDIAIGRAAMVFTDLRRAGVEVEMLNLGGGFPARYRGGDVPPIEDFADAIMKSMTRHFGNHLPAMIIEPGRCIAAEAGVLQTEVVLVSRKSYDASEPRWVYLDVGKFGGLAETMDEAIRYPIDTPYGEAAETGEVIIAGPTCDGADILYETSGYRLPLALKAGDKVRLLSAGAYTAPYASQGFDGFAPMREHYI